VNLPNLETSVRHAATRMGIHACVVNLNFAEWSRVWYWRKSYELGGQWETMKTDMDLSERDTFVAVTTAMRMTK